MTRGLSLINEIRLHGNYELGEELTLATSRFEVEAIRSYPHSHYAAKARTHTARPLGPSRMHRRRSALKLSSEYA
jgi:hypothetical protein